MNLFGRNFLTLKDYTREEIEYLLDLAMKLKVDKKKGITGDRLKGKNIACFLRSLQPEQDVRLL